MSFASAMAIPIAAFAGWMLGAAWYRHFGDRWRLALGKTQAEMVGPSGRPSPLPLAVSFIAELVMATVLSILVAQLGLGTAAGGMSVGILAWLGFVAATLGTNHGYSGAPPALTLIDGGHWLAVLLVQGLIIGGLA